MKIATAQQILKLLRNSTVRMPGSMLIHKVATRWVAASMAQEYDLMIRTQVLEGLAGVPVDTWVRKGGRQGIAAANKFFTDRFPGNRILPEWWDPTSVETIRILTAITKQNITKFRINADPFEFINSVLTGLSANESKGADRLRPAYQLGVKDRSPIMKKMMDSDEMEALPAPDHIIDGKISPVSVAKTGLSKAIFRRISDYHRDQHPELIKQDQVDDEGVTKDHRYIREGMPIEKFIADLMFGPSDDSLAKRVQDTMKASWPNNSIIDKWFGTIQLTGDVPQRTEFADLMGVSKQYFGTYLTTGLEKAVRAIWNDTRLRRAIEDRMIQEGVDGDLPDTLFNVSKHVKVATSNKLRSILAAIPAWLLRHAGTKVR